MIPPLEKRKANLAPLRDKDGNPLDIRALAAEKFLSSKLTDREALAKVSSARMGLDDRSEYRRWLADACEQGAKLMADLRPSLRKASERSANHTDELKLREAARKLRSLANAEK